MNFTFSEEQEMLRRSAREFLADRFPIERVAEVADGEGFDPAGWSEAAELGWTSISVPETAGGAGMGFLEEMVVIEELGRALYPGPFFSTVVLALPALVGVQDVLAGIVGGKQVATFAWAGTDGELDPSALPASAGRQGEGWRLSGTLMFVPDLSLADLVVVAARTEDGPALYLVERDGEGIDWKQTPTVDTTRSLGTLTFENAPARLITGPPDARSLLERTRDRGLAALAAEAVGVAEHALELAVGHAKERRQFGRPIGVFQAVGHELADGYVETENARSLAYWAGWAVAHGTDDAPEAAAAAKAYAAEAAVDMCERAIQTHGGIGFTWEHPLHRFYKRALWIASFMGWPAAQRARVAEALLGTQARGG
jgi:alkylation response protein AidB-like acyl-CoA dehydrogenase